MTDPAERMAVRLIREAIEAQLAPPDGTAVVPSALVIGILVAQNAPAVASEILRIFDNVLDGSGNLGTFRAGRDQFLAELRDYAAS